MKKSLLFVIVYTCILSVQAQPWMKAPYLNVPEGTQISSLNFYQIQSAFRAYEKEHPEIRIAGEEDSELNDNSGWLQYKRWEEFMEPRVYPSGDMSLPAQAGENFKSYLDSITHGHIFREPSELSTTSYMAGNWISLGPTLVTAGSAAGVNGRIDFVRVNPSNSNILWVGSQTGGLWRSTDAGVTWTIMTDQLPFIGCSDVAFANSNPNIMYLATGTIGGPGYPYDVGIRKSTDGGNTWTALSISGMTKVKKIKVNTTNNNIVVAATDNGIYRTNDAGTTWTRTQAGNFCDVDLMPGNSSVVYATAEGFNSTRFYRSSDGGISFNEVTSGLPGAASDLLNYKIGVSPANANYVYLVARDQTTQGFGGVFRSTDGGMNFVTQCDTDAWIRLLYNSDFTCIGVNPQDAEDLYIGGFTAYHSIDGGVTWAANGGGIYLDFHCLEFVPGTSSGVFACNDGGFYKKQNSSAAWTYLGNGLQISQMYRMGGTQFNPGWVMTGLQDVGLFQLKNGSWTELYQSDGTGVIIDPVDTNTIYFSIQCGGVLKSVNGGGSFSFLVSSCCTGINGYSAWLTPLIMNPSNHKTLLIGKTDLYRTYDGGANWTMLNVPTSFYYFVDIAYAPSDTNYIYAIRSNKFYYSTDGTNFTASTYAFTGSLSGIAVSNTNPLKVWAATSGYSSGNKIYQSNDGGISWTDYSAGLPNLPVNCLVYENNTNNQLYAGMDVGVYYRNDGMSSWQAFFNGLPNVQVRDMEIQYSSHKLRAATFGRGLWETPLASVIGIEETYSGNDFISIYPNPGNGRFNLKTKLNSIQEGNAEISIYNSVGKLVLRKKIEEENTELNLDQPAGIYFVSFRDREHFSTQKLVIQE